MADDQSLIYLAIDNCADFKSLTVQEKLDLVPACRLVCLKKGQDVFAIEHEEKYFFIVLLGRQSLQLRNRTGLFGPGDLFGEIVLFSQEGRLGTIHCEEDSKLVIVNKEYILQPGILPLDLCIKLLRILGGKMAGYFYKDAPLPIKELLKKDECCELEFKESYSRALRPKIYETIAAFMNAKGGNMLIGVNDQKKVVGVKLKTSFDKFKNNFFNSIKSMTNKTVGCLIDLDIDKINDATIIRIIVRPSSHPVIFTSEDRKHGLFVRQDGQNSFLTNPQEIITYGKSRFNL